jgi:hypothetical protein
MNGYIDYMNDVWDDEIVSWMKEMFLLLFHLNGSIVTIWYDE